MPASTTCCAVKGGIDLLPDGGTARPVSVDCGVPWRRRNARGGRCRPGRPTSNGAGSIRTQSRAAFSAALGARIKPGQRPRRRRRKPSWWRQPGMGGPPAAAVHRLLDPEAPAAEDGRSPAGLHGGSGKGVASTLFNREELAHLNRFAAALQSTIRPDGAMKTGRRPEGRAKGRCEG